MNVDETLRGLLFRKFHIGKLRFDFLEALLAVCITAVGYLIRTPFEYGPPHWTYLLAEWYLALTAGVLVFRYTGSRKRALGTYAILLILPTVVAEGDDPARQRLPGSTAPGLRAAVLGERT